MIEYLNESYNGSSNNMLENASYYCYTIKDKETNKYYSGSRGIEGSKEHDLLINYFSSSVVTDFKQSLKSNPDRFDFVVEYFPTRAEAFLAEKKFHSKHNVGKNPMFINAISSGGTNCGAGFVLCKGDDGRTYRVSVEEYATEKYKHVSTSLMNVRTDTGIIKINRSDFDPNIHRTQFKDYVLAYDTKLKRNTKVPKELFEQDCRYVSITQGRCTVYDNIDKITKSITQEEFIKSKDRYKGYTTGKVSVIDRVTGEKKLIPRENYDKSKYSHKGMGQVVAFSMSKREQVKISKEEYDNNPQEYANNSTLVFYKVDGYIFNSKKSLNEYYKQTRGRGLLTIKQHDIQNKFKDIQTISKEDYKNGKY